MLRKSVGSQGVEVGRAQLAVRVNLTSGDTRHGMLVLRLNRVSGASYSEANPSQQLVDASELRMRLAYIPQNGLLTVLMPSVINI